MTRPKTPLLLRFMAKVDLSAGFDGCWLWTGAQGDFGHGRIQISSIGEPRRLGQAHRVAWELFQGSIPNGMVVCHECDVPACVNPGHLFLGEQADNVADMVLKGRNGHGELHGAAHPRARLSPIAVAAIRIRHGSGERQTDLAREFGIGTSQVHRIVRGSSWKH